MKRPLVLLALLAALGLGGCARGPSHTAATTAAPAASQSSAAPSATVPASQPAPSSATAASGAPSGSTPQSLRHLDPLPAIDQLPQNAMWKPGVNYNVISPVHPTSAPPGKVQVMEVFWLGCPHCYAFEPYIRAWLKSKPAYIKFVRVPVMWGPVHRLHARLFYTLEALGRDDLVETAFQTIHNGNPLIGDTEQDTYAMQLKWAQQQGLSAAAFNKAYHSAGVLRRLEHAQDITDSYHVTGVPDIIVGGRFQTDVGKAGGHARLIKLIDFLAGWVHHRERTN